MKHIKNSESEKNAQRLIKTAAASFFISFTGGTILILLYLNVAFEDPFDIIVPGFFYLGAAFFFNAIICMAKYPKHRIQLFLSSLLLLLNLPIAIYYIIIFFKH